MPTMQRISGEEYNRRSSDGSLHLNQFKPVPLPIQSADVSINNPNVLHDDDIDVDDSDDELGALAYKSSRTAKLREAEEIHRWINDNINNQKKITFSFRRW